MSMDHGLFDYSPITERPRLILPHGARIAVFVAPNFEHFHYDKPAISIAPTTASFSPDIMNYSWRDYGARVGVWRMMEVMDRHGIPGTVALNSEVCLHYPQIIKAGNELGWEWMGHGTTNSMFHTAIEIDDERQIIATAIDTIGAHTGTRPKGWLGPGLTETHNTLDLLAEAGIEYVADWVNDDQPYRMNVKSGRMFAIPYSLEINDLTAFMFQGRSAEEFGQMIKDQFDVLYRESETISRVMSICVHPLSIGHPFRSKYFDAALGYIKGHDDVWFARGQEIIDWFATSTEDAD